MTGKEAAAALAQVDITRQRLAARTRWSFARHGMFGLGEGLVVAGLAQPSSTAVAMLTLGIGLFAWCVFDDRTRHGMFVSGWRRGNTRPLTLTLVVIVLALGAASASVRDGSTIQPVGLLIGAVAFVLCTIASLWWERIYRAELADTGSA